MLVKALTSFTGHLLNMAVNEVREITDKEILSDLLAAGYVEEVKPKGGGKGESKRDSSK